MMYTTYINIQIERQLDREEEEEVGTGICTQHRTIDREIVYREEVQVDVYHIQQQID